MRSGAQLHGQQPYGTNHKGRGSAQRLHWQTGPAPAIMCGRNHPVDTSPHRQDNMSDQEPNRGDKRLQDIDRRIAQLQGDQEQSKTHERHALPPGMGAILGRVATELVAGVMVGTFIGWVLDRWLGTTPLFMVLLLFLGAAAGMLNVWRMVSGRGMATGYFDEHRRDAGDDSDSDTDGR